MQGLSSLLQPWGKAELCAAPLPQRRLPPLSVHLHSGWPQDRDALHVAQLSAARQPSRRCSACHTAPSQLQLPLFPDGVAQRDCTLSIFLALSIYLSVLSLFLTGLLPVHGMLSSACAQPRCQGVRAQSILHSPPPPSLHYIAVLLLRPDLGIH